MEEIFKKYRRKGLSEMRPYVKGEDLSGISVSATDNPEEDMGMIARNPNNHKDQWYVARKYFEDNLEEVTEAKIMDFGNALEALKGWKKVARKGWNGKGMWLALSPGSKRVPADNFWASRNSEYAQSVGGVADVLPCITMKTATGEILMGWLASQTDMLAEDWIIIE